VPPLRSENCFVLNSTEEQIELRDRLSELKSNVYLRMNNIIPRKGSGVSRFKEESSPKAAYQVDGQPENEFTRAWLTRTRDFDEITLKTDKVVIANGETSVVEGSEFKHFGMGKTSNMYSDHYLDLDKEQSIELMESASDTIQLIEVATFNILH